MEALLIVFYVALLLFIFYLLAKICEEHFVASLDVISGKLKLSEDVAGATLMAVGSSAPEFFTALFAILSSSEEVGAGTIVGSAIFNILVIVGASALVATAFLNWKPVIRDLIFYIIAIILLYLTFSDGVITLTETVVYIAGYMLYLIVLVVWGRVFPHSKQEEQLEEIAEVASELEKPVQKRSVPGKVLRGLDVLIDKCFPNLEKNPKLYLVSFAISIGFIIVLSWGLVETAVELSELLGIPAVIISLTVLAGGTSIPDLISSVVVARQGRGDMAVSNAVGSNIFDIFICLGLPWLLVQLFKGEEIVVGTENLNASIMLLFFTVIALLTLLILQKFKIGRPVGIFLIALYVGYLLYSIVVAVI